MNITAFKEGDIITRNEPVTYAHDGHKDSSWCGDRLKFLAVDPVAKIIFVQHLEQHFLNEILNMSYARDPWDEGWEYYPYSLWERLVSTYSKVKGSLHRP